MTILERIDELRQLRGWSVNYLAMEAMLTQSTLNNLYVRKTEPKISTLRAICDAFGVSLSEFFAGMEKTDCADGDEAELKQIISRLPQEQKKALLTLLLAIKNK